MRATEEAVVLEGVDFDPPCESFEGCDAAAEWVGTAGRRVSARATGGAGSSSSGTTLVNGVVG